ncbi:hypothetical protein AB0O76_17830 [Streptomyces sp. NPDC086554]|uniref:hypothetical protein n=1 Tax=Streptomyces sp. NPDC086554 TaxID=3154864 RepID=UPI003435DC9A
MPTPLLTNRTTGAVLGYDVILGRDEVMAVDTFESTVALNGETGTSLLTGARPEPSFVLAPGAQPARLPGRRGHRSRPRRRRRPALALGSLVRTAREEVACSSPD